MHNQRRWFAFHPWAVEAAALTDHEVFFRPSPLRSASACGLAHFTPAILGCPTVLAERFDGRRRSRPDRALSGHRPGLCSTQFIMLLNEQRAGRGTSPHCAACSPAAKPSLRAGRRISRTVFGAAVLQFYGSNETGALSRTTVTDSRERRLRTAGRVHRRDARPPLRYRRIRYHRSGRPGIPGAGDRPPAWGTTTTTTPTPAVSAPDGWMLMGDSVDDRGRRLSHRRGSHIRLHHPGREEHQCASRRGRGRYPSRVALAAAVAMPDEVFGEKVCVYVEVTTRLEELGTLRWLVAHLPARGVTNEWFPERLIVVRSLPRSSGGKVAKADSGRRPTSGASGADPGGAAARARHTWRVNVVMAWVPPDPCP